MKNTRRGFTLIELIVCIALILILVAILFPVFNRAKGRAKAIVCTSNLRQVYVAIKLYQQDNGEYPPNSFNWDGFKPYYPLILECPVSAEQYPEYDYIAIWSAVGDKRSDEAWEKCKEIRGGSLPLAVDDKHIDPQTGYAEFLVLLREDGSVDTRIVGKDPYSNLACDTRGTFWMYGF